MKKAGLWAAIFLLAACLGGLGVRCWRTYRELSRLEKEQAQAKKEQEEQERLRREQQKQEEQRQQEMLGLQAVLEEMLAG